MYLEIFESFENKIIFFKKSEILFFFDRSLESGLLLFILLEGELFCVSEVSECFLIFLFIRVRI